MKLRKRIISALIVFILGCFSCVNAVTVRTLRGRIGNNPDVSQKQTQIRGSRSFLDIISLVNGYLWFIIGLVCFAFMVRNGYQLIMARGDQNKLKKATAALTGCAVGLVVCILAYIIVNVAINLFK